MSAVLLCGAIQAYGVLLIRLISLNTLCHVVLDVVVIKCVVAVVETLGAKDLGSIHGFGIGVCQDHAMVEKPILGVARLC